MYYDVKETAERIRILRTGSDLPRTRQQKKWGCLSVDTVSWSRDRTEEV